MLRRNHSIQQVFKAFNSTLSVDYAAAQASIVGAPVKHEERHTQTLTSSSINACRSISNVRDTLRGLESLYALPGVEYGRSTRDTVSTNQLREYLRRKEYVDFLIHVMVQNHLNRNYIKSLFETKELSTSEFSTFINRLLQEKDLDLKLSNIIPDTVHTEIIFNLYQIYCTYVIKDSQNGLTPLQVHDINRFIKRFIDEAQLKKAQECLQFLIDKQGLHNILQSGDVETITQFLQLRCGALQKFWRVDSNSTKVLGEDSKHFKSPKSYNLLKEQPFLEIVNFLLKDKSWRLRSSPIIDSAIVYSLSNLGQTKLIDQYIQLKWGISEDGHVAVKNEAVPGHEVLINIVSAYCLKNGDTGKGLRILDQFMKKYPQTELEKLFWRRLLQLSFHNWDKQKDKKALVCHGCWNIMKQWHEQKGVSITYDSGTLRLLYQLFKFTRNGRGAAEVVRTCFSSVYAKQPYQISKDEMDLLLMFQKLALKTMALKGRYNEPLQLIKEWNVDKINQHYLLDYFMRHRRKYDLTRDKARAKQQQQQAQYDNMEEEDMLLGRLW